MPSEKQILGARIRAANEAYVLANRKPYNGQRGSWVVPSSEERNRYLSEMFDMPPREVSYYLTYSRSCTHAWSEGACDRCPD